MNNRKEEMYGFVGHRAYVDGLIKNPRFNQSVRTEKEADDCLRPQNHGFSMEEISAHATENSGAETAT